jgi:hypothetical protein
MWGMRRLVASVALIMVLSGAAFAMSFGELKGNLDTEKNTRVFVKEYWGKAKGREVTWRGVVTDVRGGARKRYKVFMRVNKKAGHYNVVLVTHQREAASLKKGQSIKFSGFLHDFSWVSGKQFREFIKKSKWSRDITIVLSDGRIL